MTRAPAISIVTPSYRQGQFLERTIQSVLRQSYPKLEYVVMDGGSSDQTPEILERHRGSLTHVESAPDRGQADAVVRGFSHTTGEIMAYLNSDDLLAPGSLAFVANYFVANPDVDAVYSNRVFIDENDLVESYWILPPHRDWLMKRWDYIPQETCFWRRRIYEEVGGINPSFQFALDYDLFVRFMERGRMRRVNRFFGAFRKHASSKTAGLVAGKVHPEIARVRAEHGIWLPPKQWVFELALHKWIQARSRRFAARAGTGYVWDGQRPA